MSRPCLYRYQNPAPFISALEVSLNMLEQFIPWCRDFVISHKCLSILVDSVRGPHTQVWPVSSITLRLIGGAGSTLKWLQCKKSDPNMAICWSHARKAIWKNREYKTLRLQPLLEILKEQKYNGQSTQSNLNLKFDVLWLVAPIQLILLITKIQQKTRLGRLVVTSPSLLFLRKWTKKRWRKIRKTLVTVLWSSTQRNETAELLNPWWIRICPEKKKKNNSGLAGIFI